MEYFSIKGSYPWECHRNGEHSLVSRELGGVVEPKIDSLKISTYRQGVEKLNRTSNCSKWYFWTVLKKHISLSPWIHIFKLKNERRGKIHSSTFSFRFYKNDPSAGSPTETLLRLLLPLSSKVWLSSSQKVRGTQSIQLSQSLTGPLNR